MAMKTFLIFSGLCGLLTFTGCTPGPHTLASLPSPSFAAPMVVFPDTPLAVQNNRPPQPTNAPPIKPVASGNEPAGWVPPANVKRRNWNWIIIHHSDTVSGGAAAFDKMHKAKGWDGLGYDFVIGNGTDTADGQVEVGFRWTQQRIGAHAKTANNQFNERGIGICLVGNFMVDRPTAAQMKSLVKLVTYLMVTYHIPPDRILGHGDTKPTDCPGKFMNVPALRATVRRNLAAAGIKISAQTPAPRGELLHVAAR